MNISTYFILTIFFLWSIFALQLSFVGSDYNGVWAYIPISLLLLLEVISVLFLFLNIKKIGKNKLNSIIFLWLLYVIFNTTITSKNLFVDLREAIWWPLVYFLFYFIVLGDRYEKRTIFIRNFFIFLFIILSIQYFFNRIHDLFTKSVFEIFFSSNQVFFVLLLSPFLFFSKNNRRKYLYLLIALIATLLSFKRSSFVFIFGVLSIAVYFDYIKNMNFFKGFFSFCIIATIIYFTINYIDSFTDGYILQRISNIQDDKGSGRLDIYEFVWDNYKNMDLGNKIFGVGHDGVRKNGIIFLGTKPISAHNDFLEILYDFGIVGIIIYSIFVIRLLKMMFKTKFDKKLYQANISSFFIFLVMSMVSHLVIYPNYHAFLVAGWGMSSAILFKTKKINKLLCRKLL